MAYNFKKLDEKISGAISFFEKEAGSIRAGRANPAIIEDLKIEAYGTIQPLKNIAAISVADAKTLSVSPWDKTIIDVIQKAIESAGMGLRPAAQKDFIRVSLPDLTEERRKSLLKLLSEKLEEARVSIRKTRDEVWKDIQDQERAKTLSQDEKFRLKEQMEEKVKKGTDKLEEIAKRKNSEIGQ